VGLRRLHAGIIHLGRGRQKLHEVPPGLIWRGW
jgi:hypothetical protein